MSSAAGSPADDGVLIETIDLVREYPDGHVQALQGVNLVVRRGEYVAIMGPSGSGKSTLLHLLGGLDRPTRGEVRFAGRSLAEYASLDGYRASQVGFVFQSFYLLPTLTALQNVQVPMFEGRHAAAERRRRAAELLVLVGLESRMQHRPKQLSVGERQRVAIARALANDPRLLLADEPTGSLDSHTGEAILELFDRLHRKRGMTLIVVTHSPAVGAAAERVIWLRDGREAPATEVEL